MSPVRWLRAVAVVAATALLMASSCSWQSGIPIPEGVPPPAGDPVPDIDTNAKGRPADQLHRWAAAARARARHPGDCARGLRLRGAGRRGGEPELQHRRGRRSQASAWSKVTTARTAVATVAPNGDVTPPIRGVRLDGSNGKPRNPRHRRRQARRRRDLRPGDGAHAVHPRDVAAVRGRRQQRRRHQPRQHRRRGAVGGRVPVLAREATWRARGDG